MKLSIIFITITTVFSCFIFSCSKPKDADTKNDSNPVIVYPIVHKNDKPLDEKIHTVKLKKIFEIKRDDNASIYVSCADKANNFYATHWLTDRNGGNEIFIYDKTGKIIKSFGRRGQGPGEYTNPYYMSILNDTVLLYENSLNKIIKHDLSGKHLYTLKTKQQGVSFQNDSIMIFSGLRQKKLNTSKYLVENAWEIYNTKNNNDSIFWLRSCETAGSISTDIMDISAIDQSNNKIYISTLSADQYEIEVFDFTGKKIAIIKKRYTPVALNIDDKKTLGTDNNYAQAINKLYIDKKGRLLVNPNVLRTSTNNEYYFDVFENGEYLFRTILPEKEYHIFDYDQVNFINNRLYVSKAGEPNVLTCYEYEIE